MAAVVVSDTPAHAAPISTERSDIRRRHAGLIDVQLVKAARSGHRPRVAVSISEAMVAQLAPPSSLPAKSAFFRFKAMGRIAVRPEFVAAAVQEWIAAVGA